MCGRKNDNGDTDLKFAINNKIKFYAPEEIFLDTIYDLIKADIVVKVEE